MNTERDETTPRAAGRFLLAIWNTWQGKLTGGTLLALVFLAEHLVKIPVPDWVFWFIAVASFLFSVFRVWRAEREQRIALETVRGGPVRRLSEEEFWLLAITKRCGLRRETLPNPRPGGYPFGAFLLIGNELIDDRESEWFYDLVNAATKGDLLEDHDRKLGPAAAAERAFEDEWKKGRQAKSPSGPLINAETRAVVNAVLG